LGQSQTPQTDCRAEITVFPVLILLLINYLLNLFANGAVLQAEIHNVVIISVLILHFSLAIWINTRKPQVLTGKSQDAPACSRG